MQHEEFLLNEPTYPTTDTRQNERQRERQGSVVDYSEQEFARHRETLAQLAEADEAKHEAVGDTPEAERGDKYPGHKYGEKPDYGESSH